MGNINNSDAVNQTASVSLEEIKHEFLIRRSHFNDTENMLITIAYCIVAVVGLVGNGLVCYVFVRHKHMQTTRNAFIVNLAVADLILSATLIPFIRQPQVYQIWNYGEPLCKFFNVFSGTNVYCSSLTIVAIAADRYHSVAQRAPGEALKKCSLCIAILAIWFVSFLFCLPIFMYYYVTPFLFPKEALKNVTILNDPDPNASVVYLFDLCSFQPSSTVLSIVGVLQALFMIPIPFLGIAFYNILLHRILQKNRRFRMSLQAKRAKTSVPASSIVEYDTLSVQPVSEQRKQSNMSRYSVASNQTNSQDRHFFRLTLLLACMAGSHAILWLPFTIITWSFDFYIEALKEQPSLLLLFNKLDVLFILMGQCSIAINPILYGYLNTNFNREFKVILRSCCLASNNTSQGKKRSGPSTTLKRHAQVPSDK